MSDKNKALSNQISSDTKTDHSKAIQRLNVALKVADFALKLISIAGKLVEWFG